MNANSTALAVQALQATGVTGPLAAARRYLTGLQYDCDASSALRGGVAYAVSARSTRTPTDQDRRATTQAALALAGGTVGTATAAGAAPNAPALACASPTTSTTTTSEPSGTSSTDDDSGYLGVDETVEPGTIAGTALPASASDLPRTGTEVAPLVATGTGLLGLGVLALLLARVTRRRHGRHA
ncbi:hypothetical protein GCM10025868_42790 [Angustibacter aerolatus]|uniref:Gram-positive cocci surface proteins LPxTG domain-containing protein n=1 Tax=Angustibacter aerolatus TaxID=1162965 RepID=A0ABQ6JPG9_9ACTN|nr:hypothetical protein GCM10025868_42790 [Angustibacter aerolatus]